MIDMGLSAEVTRRKLVLGSQDTITGWFAPSYTEEDIDMVILPSGSQYLRMLPGADVRFDAVGRTADPILPGDQIRANGIYYTIKEVKPWYILNSFAYRDAQLAELSTYEAGAEPKAASASSAAVDPRTRTKTFLDLYLSGGNICKNDGATPAPFITAFGYPPYSFQYVFKAPKQKYVVYAIDEPNNSRAIPSGDQITRRYEITIPIHILCIDQPDATGTILKSNALKELRRICEEYQADSPISFRLLDREIPHDRPLGGFTLYDTEYNLLYRTDTT